MKQFLQEAQQYAVKKAKTDKQVQEINHNFKEIYKLTEKLEKLKYDGKTKTT